VAERGGHPFGGGKLRVRSQGGQPGVDLAEQNLAVLTDQPLRRRDPRRSRRVRRS
jgi:hypothetical protein